LFIASRLNAKPRPFSRARACHGLPCHCHGNFQKTFTFLRRVTAISQLRHAASNSAQTGVSEPVLIPTPADLAHGSAHQEHDTTADEALENVMDRYHLANAALRFGMGLGANGAPILMEWREHPHQRDRRVRRERAKAAGKSGNLKSSNRLSAAALLAALLGFRQRAAAS
jgi:hypothetical protein